MGRTADKDPVTGYLTKARYIPLIQTKIKHIVSYLFLFHIAYSAVRMAFHHEILLTSWFILDISDTPTYVLVYTIQVQYTVYILKNLNIIKNNKKTYMGKQVYN